MYKRKEIGKLGEDLSEKYLFDNGYKILNRNFYCNQGEIDIIAEKNSELIFVEVKTRTNMSYGTPAEAVTTTKRNHIRKVAKYYIHINGLYNKNIRFDIIEVYIKRNLFNINHIKQAL